MDKKLGYGPARAEIELDGVLLITVGPTSR